MKITGNLIIYPGDKTDYSKLTEVSGSIDVRQNATLTAPALTEVSGSIDVRQNATLTAPALTKSGSIYVSENATLTAPALTEVSGSIYVSENATLTAPALTEVSGSIDVRQNATLTAPALTKSGSIDVRQNATLTAPALTKSGSIDVSENATLTAPALKCKSNTATFGRKKHKILHNDGLCFYAESTRTSKGIKVYAGYTQLTISDGVVAGEKGYLVEKEGYSAHATSLKKAIADLNFKIVAEKLAKEPIYPDTVVSMQHYRLVTGACEYGCQQWMAQNNITVDAMPAKELLPLLEKTHAYGLDRFKQLIAF
ncbi:DUF4097 family beta strand repeat-containing protein [Pontibacter burrus]|uniref:DUF4097 domain-containing protein n=1 Tax=Pontibacter burrus TaxID=2704466 RepID=A0A6B3LHX3_9BACT|nr:DUF4097 family beta strand repeat-containing protein [Pontibacter burrus]NEM96189.1 hypothetical protein [Pontibacter burrus]